MLFLLGQGVEQDHEQARTLLRLAAHQGVVRAQRLLGSIYEQGLGVATNDAEAAHWYAQAAEQGDAVAQHRLGLLLHAGRGLEQDCAQAKTWFARAAEQGLAEAQFSLGWAYYRGEGARQDDRHAARWFARAAEQGLALAQANLGLLLAEGRGVERDDARAVHWLERAAEQGLPYAQFNLGLLLRARPGRRARPAPLRAARRAGGRRAACPRRRPSWPRCTSTAAAWSRTWSPRTCGTAWPRPPARDDAAEQVARLERSMQRYQIAYAERLATEWSASRAGTRGEESLPQAR